MEKDTQKHILLAEDDKNLLGMMEYVLKREGFFISIAHNGKEALEKIMEAKEYRKPIDLLITDIGMPKMNGCELINNLQKKALPMTVMAIGSNTKETTENNLGSLKCADYLRKPFGPCEFMHHVNGIIES